MSLTVISLPSIVGGALLHIKGEGYFGKIEDKNCVFIRVLVKAYLHCRLRALVLFIFFPFYIYVKITDSDVALKCLAQC